MKYLEKIDLLLSHSVYISNNKLKYRSNQPTPNYTGMYRIKFKYSIFVF